MLLFILPLLISCEIQYDGETKLVVKGVIVDENNQPISGKDVKLIVSRDNGYGYLYSIPNEDNYIGKTTSKSDGSFVMVIPKPENFSQIIVETNSNDNLLNLKQFVNIKMSNFNYFELVLPQTKLYKKADLSLLNVIPNQVTPNYQLLKIEYVGDISNEYELINPLEYNDLYNTTVSVKKNQTIIIRYTVKDFVSNQILELEQNVIIGDTSETNYTLNY